jgi:hypothetical protein
VAGLADVIAGTVSGDAGPLAPEELQAARGLQLQQAAMDNSQWANQGWGGALAHAIAGFAGPSMAQGAVGDLTQQRIASLPALAEAYSSPDPYQWAAQNPQADPIARWSVLGQSPAQMAAVKNALADAALRQAQALLPVYQQQQRQNPNFGQTGYITAPPSGGDGGGGVPSSASAAAPAIGGGRYPTTNTSTLPISPTSIPPGKVQAYLATLNPTQKAQAMAILRSQYSAPAPTQ